MNRQDFDKWKQERCRGIMQEKLSDELYNLLGKEISEKDEEINRLKMENMTHEYNQAEAEKFRPEYEKQLKEEWASQFPSQGLTELPNVSEQTATDDKGVSFTCASSEGSGWTLKNESAPSQGLREEEMTQEEWNDVAEVPNPDLASVASHSSTVGNSIEHLKYEKVFEFSTFQNWLNTAKIKFSKYEKSENDKSQEIICLDINGNCLTLGEDFAKAEKENLFPITAYRLIRTIEVQNDERSVASKAQPELPAYDQKICKKTGQRCTFICIMTECWLIDEQNKNATSTPDGSQGLREALKQIEQFSDGGNPYSDIAKIKSIATEALKK